MSDDHLQSTALSVLLGVTHEGCPEQRHVYLQQFCETYSKPLVTFLTVNELCSSEMAEDLVQDFWLHKMIEPAPDQTLVAKYLTVRQNDPQASFRAYLCESLTNDVDGYQPSHAAKEQQPIQRLDANDLDRAIGVTDHQSFDFVWANYLLENVLWKVRKECLLNGHDLKWKIFLRLFLSPKSPDEPRQTYSDLAGQFGIRSTKEIGNAWITVKRMFVRNFNSVVRDYLPANSVEESISDAKQEVKSMLFELSSSGRLWLYTEDWELDSEPSPSSAKTSQFSASHLFRTRRDFEFGWRDFLGQPLSESLGLDAKPWNHLTFASLLKNPALRLKQLSELHKRSKQLGRRTDLQSPEEFLYPIGFYAIVYFVAIAIAKSNHGADISSHTAQQLSRRTKTVADSSWIDEDSRQWLDRLL
ncbi:hypothetical protein CA13_03650 [Planctomycetes bacterium CA13]|uniref:Uncharacterized protein n=1 Tax=Novipirellula herctigrandis TaxID=2527986 RepID=A0A5C5YVC7_9BACT|nr:hypothetical protein CA13_03650 [Planctomycetes bacterium CA13]